jgi:DNA (cytosine-5)-methyltransferase 1
MRMRNEKAFKMGELFCGPGGFGYAAKTTFIKTEDKSFRIVHAWANDYDQDTCNTYRLNVCPDKPDSVVCGDIRKLDMSVFKDISSIDALVFGFPCNYFSIVG